MRNGVRKGSLFIINAGMKLNLTGAVLAAMMLCSCASIAQKRWIGGSGKWDDIQNWQPASLPDSTDQVILDNSFQLVDYMVELPAHAVIVNALIIAPASGRQIELHLPASSFSSPAFTARATGDGITIRSGGVFRNSSGLSGGQSLSLNGLMRIETSGAYVHNTRSSHAGDVVARLSTSPGTENGTVEFDVPGGSYPLSMSNRVYGKLVLSAHASGGTQTYNASGTNPLLVRGDFVIGTGVAVNIDFTKDITIQGSLVQEGGVFNLASQPDTNVVNIKGNISQLPGAIITETSTGTPLIELNGTTRQQVSLSGSITNEVALRISNAAGIFLLRDLTIPYLLQLTQGNIITSRSSLLIMAPGSRITGASSGSFVEGPVRKRGDEPFAFPVGKQGDYAPVTITAGSSIAEEYTVEYFPANPQAVFGTQFDHASLVRVSALEYWNVERTGGSSVRKITLSVGTYSHATAIDKLAVCRWEGAQASWKSEGNSSYSGISIGTVTSNPLSGLGAFTLGSTTIEQNPLPLRVREPGTRPAGDPSFRVVAVTSAGSKVSLHLVSDQRQRLQVMITAIDGRTVYRLSTEISEGEHEIVSALPVLASGIYVLQVSDAKGRVRTIQFVKR